MIVINGHIFKYQSVYKYFFKITFEMCTIWSNLRITLCRQCWAVSQSMPLVIWSQWGVDEILCIFFSKRLSRGVWVYFEVIELYVRHRLQWRWWSPLIHSHGTFHVGRYNACCKLQWISLLCLKPLYFTSSYEILHLFCKQDIGFSKSKRWNKRNKGYRWCDMYVCQQSSWRETNK